MFEYGILENKKKNFADKKLFLMNFDTLLSSVLYILGFKA